MFSSDNSENGDNKIKIKRRLIGALVLIALAVIIIPLLLDFRKDGQVKGTNIPPKPDDFRTEVVPLTLPDELKTLPPVEDNAETPAEISPPPESPEPDSEAENAASAPVKSPDSLPDTLQDTSTPASPPAEAESDSAVTTDNTPEPVESPAPVKSTAPANPPAKPPAKEITKTVTDGWIIQLGSFSNKKNAEELRAKLQKKGYKAFVDQLKVDGKLTQRVRIGPMADKTKAEALRDKLIAEMKLHARVFSYP